MALPDPKNICTYDYFNPNPNVVNPFNITVPVTLQNQIYAAVTQLDPAAGAVISAAGNTMTGALSNKVAALETWVSENLNCYGSLFANSGAALYNALILNPDNQTPPYAGFYKYVSTILINNPNFQRPMFNVAGDINGGCGCSIGVDVENLYKRFRYYYFKLHIDHLVNVDYANAFTAFNEDALYTDIYSPLCGVLVPSLILTMIGTTNTYQYFLDLIGGTSGTDPCNGSLPLDQIHTNGNPAFSNGITHAYNVLLNLQATVIDQLPVNDKCGNLTTVANRLKNFLTCFDPDTLIKSQNIPDGGGLNTIIFTGGITTNNNTDENGNTIVNFASSFFHMITMVLQYVIGDIINTHIASPAQELALIAILDDLNKYVPGTALANNAYNGVNGYTVPSCPMDYSSMSGISFQDLYNVFIAPLNVANTDCANYVPNFNSDGGGGYIAQVLFVLANANATGTPIDSRGNYVSVASLNNGTASPINCVTNILPPLVTGCNLEVATRFSVFNNLAANGLNTVPFGIPPNFIINSLLRTVNDTHTINMNGTLLHANPFCDTSNPTQFSCIRSYIKSLSTILKCILNSFVCTYLNLVEGFPYQCVQDQLAVDFSDISHPYTSTISYNAATTTISITQKFQTPVVGDPRFFTTDNYICCDPCQVEDPCITDLPGNQNINSSWRLYQATVSYILYTMLYQFLKDMENNQNVWLTSNLNLVDVAIQSQLIFPFAGNIPPATANVFVIDESFHACLLGSLCGIYKRFWFDWVDYITIPVTVPPVDPTTFYGQLVFQLLFNYCCPFDDALLQAIEILILISNSGAFNDDQFHDADTRGRVNVLERQLKVARAVQRSNITPRLFGVVPRFTNGFNAGFSQ